MAQNICNPVALAELVGRELILDQMPSVDSFQTRRAIDRIYRINENFKDIDTSLGKIQEIHGPYRGASAELVSFAKNLFGADPNFRASIFELENIFIEFQRVYENGRNLIDAIDNTTIAGASTALMRAYLSKVDILLPDKLKEEIQDNLEAFPMFTEMSEALGTLYTNFIINDGATNMVDVFIGNILDESGLSNVLSKHSWIRTIPEYAANFHNNIRLFQRLGARVLPKCTFGKIYHKMDEPLAHIYNLANDAFGFLDILDNRTKYLSALFSRFRDLIRKLNNIYPVCVNANASYGVTTVKVGNGEVDVDNFGNSVTPVERASVRNDDGLIIVTNDK